MGIMPRANAVDQVWLLCQRQINGQTVNTVEYFADETDYPIKQDYFSGPDNEDADLASYNNVSYETQKGACHVDMATEFVGLQSASITAIKIVPTNSQVTWVG